MKAFLGIAVQKAVGLFLVLCLFGACAQTGMNKTAGGALTGSALGAGLGAIVGSQSGHAGPGIAIGAAAGALGGALVGNQLDNADDRQRELESRSEANQRLAEENKRLIEELRMHGADARSSARGIVINLPDVLFEFDKARITPDARRIIEEIASVITSSNRPISVEGHTDSVGSVQYNKKLSLDRASAVANALQDNGIPRARMAVRGFGEGSPIASNNSDTGRARNRRVEVVMENQ